MEHMKELIAMQKPILLDGGNFGNWKVHMRHAIRGIDEEALVAVVNGLSEPTMIEEKKKKAISTIFSAIDIDQFKIIQGCESAKVVWGTLVNYFEGDTNVKRTCFDHVETNFTAKLNTIANEAVVLGKRMTKTTKISC
ncbi:hypothetical protein N665_0069s0045 [Sinapis alba]|nr:hypothetical protein N665_0069s0045 [Sinapis alba]